MNITEFQARRWIAKAANVREDEIRYSKTSTPDFTLPDGSTYEVKRLYGDKIIVYPSQLEALSYSPDTEILVFGVGDKDPVARIPTKELLECVDSGRTSWQNIRIITYGSPLRVVLGREEWEALKRYFQDNSNLPGITVGRIGRFAILQFLESKGYYKPTTQSAGSLLLGKIV